MSTLIYANRYSEINHIIRILKMYKIKNFAVVPKGSENVAQHMRLVAKFDSGDIEVLIGTDNNSRGINFQSPKRIINWNPPYSIGDYLNRIGRGGRLGHTNIAHVYTFIR
jgi:superfamily II DNA/RNA helicase